MAGILYIAPALIGLLVFYLLPFLVTISYSFRENMGSTDFVGLKNYIMVWNSTSFRLALWNTIRFALAAIPLTLGISLFLAMLLYRMTRGSDFFRTVFVFPLTLPVASVVLFCRIFFYDTGPINKVLEAAGLSAVDWLHSNGAFLALLLLYLWKNSGYAVVLFLSALHSVPITQLEAAKMDGAGAVARFFYVILPSIAPHTVTILLLSAVRLFQSFRESYLLFGAHPDQSVYMLQHFIYNNFENLNYVRLSVASVLLFLFVAFPIGGLLFHSFRREDEN